MHLLENRSIYSTSNWMLGHYQLKTDIRWKTGSVSVRVCSPTNPLAAPSTFFLHSGCFWSHDQFKAGDRVVLLKDISSKRCCLIASEAFFACFGSEKALHDMLSLSPEHQMAVCSYVDGGQPCPESKAKPFSPPDVTLDIQPFLNAISSCMLPELRTAFRSWHTAPTQNHNAEKLALALNICPNYIDRNKSTSYQSILAAFDRAFIGQTALKHTLARHLAQGRQRSRRGTVILLHGLPGTGKTSWGGTIANALGLPHKEINLATLTSSMTLIGCESSYSNSSAGSIIRFFRQHGTSESVLVLDELDKASSRSNGNTSRDGNVVESIMSLLDPNERLFRDLYLDSAPIDCRNTICVLTANRLQSIAPEILSRCDLVLEVPPTSDHELLLAVKRKADALGKELGLPAGWLTPAGAKELLRYRTDFGYRDVLRYVAMLAYQWNGTKFTQSKVRTAFASLADSQNPGMRYHLHSECYDDTVRSAILSAFSKKATASSLPEQEQRSLTMQIDYLTRLIPTKAADFDPDTFYQAADKLVGLQTAKDEIAAELYADAVGASVSTPLLLVGPAGTGKTSLAEAIASACGRPYIRLQMNGVTEVSFLRGTEKEKVAADAGQIVRKLAELESTSAVIFFDEIDKMGSEAARSMLDIFDDTRKVRDDFLGISVDLRGSMLIASANDLSAINPILLSRFKIIRIDGYTPSERRSIAYDRLLPAIIQGMDVTVSPEAMEAILKRHDTEAGIRGVKHALQSVVRRCILDQRGRPSVKVDLQDVENVLGPETYQYLAGSRPGCVNGLAACGDSGLVMPISTTLLHEGARRITGLAEESIRDSVAIAETWVETQFRRSLNEGFHIHFAPAGIRKDGPSAGAAIALSLLSAATGIPLPKNTAFTGEFDGVHILPVGAITLKVLAAQSAGMEQVFLPVGCREAISPSDYSIRIHFVNTMDELVKQVFPTLSISDDRDVCNILPKRSA